MIPVHRGGKVGNWFISIYPSVVLILLTYIKKTLNFNIPSLVHGGDFLKTFKKHVLWNLYQKNNSWNSSNGVLKGFYYSITEHGWLNWYESVDDGKWYGTYEEARESAILEAIEKLKGKKL